MKTFLLLLWHFAALNAKLLNGTGTFFMNGIFNILDSGDQVNVQSGFLTMEAMKFAVDKVNKENNLLGYKMAVNKIYDSDKATEVRKNIMDTFTQEIPFLIGPYSSETSYTGSILTGTFGLVAISYGAGYSEFQSNVDQHDKMVRTVPSDAYRLQATLDTIKAIGWNYISVISSYGFDGEADARRFIARLSEINVCLANEMELPNTPTSYYYEQVIESIYKNHIKAVVMFTNKKDTRELFRVLKRKGVHGVNILCVYGCTHYKEITDGVEDILHGALSIDLRSEPTPGFEEWIANTRPVDNSSDPLLTQWWEKMFNCALFQRTTKPKLCIGNESLAELLRNTNTPVHLVMNAVYVLADAIRYYLTAMCHIDTKYHIYHKSATECVIDAKENDRYRSHIQTSILMTLSKEGTAYQTAFRQLMSTVRYDIHRFVYAEEKRNQHIGSWQINVTGTRKMLPEEVMKTAKVDFMLTTDSVVAVQCSQTCAPGFEQINDSNLMKAKCCWRCRACPRNSVSHNNRGGCRQCAITEKVVNNTCTTLPEVGVWMSSGNGGAEQFVLVAIAVFAFASLMFVGVVFAWNFHHQVLKTTGRELSILVLFGIACLFLVPVMHLFRPSLPICVVRCALPGVGFLLCYAALFLRTVRIFRILRHAKKEIYQPVLNGNGSQFGVLFIAVCIQIMFGAIWFMEKPPVPEFVVDTKDANSINLQCRGDDEPTPMLINLTLCTIFMLCCTVLAFKTRRFPKNYNEAKFIGLTLYITCVIWAVFLPTYYLTTPTNRFIREHLLSVLCVIVGMVTLTGLFAQKVRLMLCHSEDPTKERRNTKSWSVSDSDGSHNLELNASKPMI